VSGLRYVTAYAVIRVDQTNYPDAGSQEYEGILVAGPSHIRVKEIVLSADEARAEVVRLNALNAEKGCAYYWQSTHLFINGGSHGSHGEDSNATAPSAD
jgi:hypothetical protein